MAPITKTGKYIIGAALALLILAGLYKGIQIDMQPKQFVTLVNSDDISDIVDRNLYTNFKESETKPFKLVTKYRDQVITDFGSERTIDSLKCLRYQEIVKRQEILDNLNKPCK